MTDEEINNTIRNSVRSAIAEINKSAQKNGRAVRHHAMKREARPRSSKTSKVNKSEISIGRSASDEKLKELMEGLRKVVEQSKGQMTAIERSNKAAADCLRHIEEKLKQHDSSPHATESDFFDQVGEMMEESLFAILQDEKVQKKKAMVKGSASQQHEEKLGGYHYESGDEYCEENCESGSGDQEFELEDRSRSVPHMVKRGLEG